jgi:hypothetical protein
MKRCALFVAALCLSAPVFAQDYTKNVQLTIDNTAGGVSFTASDIRSGDGHPQVNSASCTSNSSGGDFRYTVDGSAPTTTVGVLVPEGGALIFNSANALLTFKAIRTAGSSAVLSCTFSTRTPLPPVYPVGAGGGSGGTSGDVNLTEVAGTPIVGANVPVDCVSGCAAATEAADDGSIPAGSTNSNANALGMVFDGAAWARLTFGQAVMASSLPVTIASNQTAVAQNLTTLGGNAVSVGNGASGTGVQRVTLANDGTGILAAVTSITNTVNTIGTLANDAGAAGTNRVPTLPGITENAAPTRTDGRNAALSLTTGGAARVMITNAAGAATTIATDTTQDAAAATTGPQIMGLGKNTTLPTAVTDGDAVRLLTDLAGRLRPKNVCADPELVSSVVISTATSGNVELVAISGTTVHVACGFNVIGGGTVGVQFISGTGTACATGETNKTGVYPLIVNSGINSGFGAPIFKGAAGEALCVELSAAVQIDGILTYATVSVP